MATVAVPTISPRKETTKSVSVQSLRVTYVADHTYIVLARIGTGSGVPAGIHSFGEGRTVDLLGAVYPVQ